MLTAVSPRRAEFVRRDNGLGRELWTAGLARALPLIDRAIARVTADVPLLEASLIKLDPTLSLRSIRARVLEVRDETADVKTYVLRPNARFGSYRPGSYVSVRVAINGRPVERTYSLSSAPSSDGLIAITVKRVPGGLVSNFLADTVRPGHVLELGAPDGQFVLPNEAPEKLLLISAGSGITPVMSMLRALLAQGSRSEITFMHFARSPDDVIFRDELARIEASAPNVRVVLCVEQAPESWTRARGRFSESLLSQSAPDFRNCPTYLCGPSPFMQAVISTLEQCEADLSKLHYERFSLEFDASSFLEHTQLVRFVRSGADSLAGNDKKPRTILEMAESRGVPLESGCRAGNCGTCRCTKKSGVVMNVLTGEDSKAGEELIYACVSVARGTVEIDL